MPIIDIVASDEPITVNLVGKTYLARPPKTTLAMKLAEGMEGAEPDAILARLEQYLTMLFGAKEGGKIRKRLDDPDDLLDVSHIMDLMTKITEVSTATPTS